MNNEQTVALSDLRAGQSGTIEKLEAQSESEIRMMAMGLLPGDKVTVLSRSAFGGPVSIEHQNQGRYAIRKSIAQNIKIKL